MPYCIHCGNRVNPEDSYCIICGAKLDPAVRSPAQQGEGPLARKAKKAAAPPPPPEVPPESPEEKGRRVGSSSPPRIDEAKAPEKQFLFIIWMLRVFFVSIMGMLVYFNDAMIENAVPIQTVMIIFVTILSIAVAEHIYLMIRSRMAGAQFTPAGLDVQPVKIYGLFSRKGCFVSKELIERVDVVRTRDAPPGALRAAPAEGVPSSMALYLKGGKVRSFANRAPEQLMAAREYAEAIWGTEVSDEGDKKELPPEDIYRTFPNTHRSNHFRTSAFMFVGITVLFGYMIVDFNLPGITNIGIMLSLVLGGLLAYMWAIACLICRRTCGVKEVKVAKEGFELVFKNKSRFYDWSELKRLDMTKSDQIKNTKERIASVSLAPRGSYLVSCEIGKALERAHEEGTGAKAPNMHSVSPKRGAFSTEEMNSLKYERPDLWRKSNLVSAALFATGILLLVNAAMHIRPVTLWGILLIMVLMFLRLQVSKEIKEHIRNGRSGGSPPSD